MRGSGDEGKGEGNGYAEDISLLVVKVFLYSCNDVVGKEMMCVLYSLLKYNKGG